VWLEPVLSQVIAILRRRGRERLRRFEERGVAVSPPRPAIALG
jgi:hypothetical protein